MIEIIGDAIPEASDGFLTRLRRFDPTLLVVWHPRRRQWMVEQCVRHLAPTTKHMHVCERIHVCMITGPDGGAMPLGDHVFTRLAAMDNWRRYGPEKLQQFIADCNRADEERKQKEQAAMAEVVRLNSRDHRRQLAQAWSLIQRHDLRVNQ